MKQRPITEIIAMRHSTRSYDGVEPGTGEVIRLRAAIEEQSADWEGRNIPLRLLSLHGEKGKRERLGTYGFSAGATLFLAGTWRLADPEIECFGYVFEKAILAATGLGFDSCWMSGTVDRKGFGSALGMGQGMVIPAVSPIGHAAGSPRLIDGIIRTGAKSATRKPMEDIFLSPEGRGLSSEDGGAWAPALEAVRLAPSASNKQPWRIIKSERGFEFRMLRTPAYRAAFSFDVQRMDIGIAMCHFDLAARGNGLRGSWALPGKAEPLAGGAKGDLIATWLGA